MADSAAINISQLLPLLLLVSLAVIALLRHQAARRGQARALLWLQALKTLMTHLQRHRGLAVAVQCGDEISRPVLEDMQRQVGRDIAHIDQLAGQLREREQWQTITSHWARLSCNALSLSVPHSLDQHTRLIQNLVVLIDSIASEHGLIADADRPTPAWRLLLELAEQLGHVRALGTLIIVRGDTAPAFGGAPARLVLARAIQAVYERLQQNSAEAQLPENVLQQVLVFLQWVDTELLQTAAAPDGVEPFFGAASAVIDQLYLQFDQRLAGLSRRLLRH